MIAPIVAAAAPEDDECPPGQVRNEDTAGHCCWEGQAWSGLYKACVGLAECPPGLIPTEDGEDCETVECGPDKVKVGDGCCFPGQRWEDGRCRGERTCPDGQLLEDGECVDPPARATRPPLPYVPIDESAAAQIDPGLYTRGSHRSEPGRFRNERSHLVSISRPILIKATEVTRSEWRMLTGYDPSRFTGCGDDCPVERVSWYDALAWLNRLSRAEGLPECYVLDRCEGELDRGCLEDDALACTGTHVCGVVGFVGLDCRGYRLPTEAEWEYAARAGTDTPTYGGKPRPVADRHDATLEPIARYAGNSGVDYADGVDCSAWTGRAEDRPKCGPGPVGRLKANPWGLRDTLGNVAEWVWDGFGRYPRHGAPDPVNDLGLQRVVRGSSWADGPVGVRAALRARMPPSGRNATVGFRWARTLPPGTPPGGLRRPSEPLPDWFLIEPETEPATLVEPGGEGPQRPVAGDDDAPESPLEDPPPPAAPLPSAEDAPDAGPDAASPEPDTPPPATPPPAGVPLRIAPPGTPGSNGD